MITKDVPLILLMQISVIVTKMYIRRSDGPNRIIIIIIIRRRRRTILVAYTMEQVD